MDLAGLKETNSLYKTYIDNWKLYQIAYMGGSDFINYAIEQHVRESSANFIARKKEAIIFNYARSIIDLYSFYLTEKDAMRNLGSLSEDKQWKAFRKDCDLYGTDFNIFVNNAQKTASIFGSSGVLVDKANSEFISQAEEIANGVYPYCNLYTLPNILNWTYKRNEINNRPYLSFLKLKNYDGKYFLWWIDKWETWEIPLSVNGQELNPILVESGDNTLGEIPFFWFINVRSPIDPYFGLSDITEVSRITASIIRDISSLQEIIKFAGFPMMRKPFPRDGESNADIVGPRGVLEFDPELGEKAKPDWLLSPVEEPIQGGLEFIGKKIDEIYETSHMSGIHALEKSSEARSGVALRYQFTQLSSVLGDKSTNMIEAELEILRLWLKWQKKSELRNTISITRSRHFSVDDMAQDIQNLIQTGKEAISTTFKKETQKAMSRGVLPDLSDDIREVIDGEIDSAEFVIDVTDESKIKTTSDNLTND